MRLQSLIQCGCEMDSFFLCVIINLRGNDRCLAAVRERDTLLRIHQISPHRHSILTSISPPPTFPPSVPSFASIAISPYWGRCPGSSCKVPLAAAECISMGLQWEPGDRPEDTSAMTLMHWLSAQCSTLQPGQVPQGSGHTYQHARTHRKSNLRIDECVRA